jgi:endoglucanase
VQLNRHGVPTIVIGVPTRYIDSGAGIIYRPDYDIALKLVVETLKRLDEKLVKDLA